MKFMQQQQLHHCQQVTITSNYTAVRHVRQSVVIKLDCSTRILEIVYICQSCEKTNVLFFSDMV